MPSVRSPRVPELLMKPVHLAYDSLREPHSLSGNSLFKSARVGFCFLQDHLLYCRQHPQGVRKLIHRLCHPTCTYWAKGLLEVVTSVRNLASLLGPESGPAVGSRRATCSCVTREGPKCSETCFVFLSSK